MYSIYFTMKLLRFTYFRLDLEFEWELGYWKDPDIFGHISELDNTFEPLHNQSQLYIVQYMHQKVQLWGRSLPWELEQHVEFYRIKCTIETKTETSCRNALYKCTNIDIVNMSIFLIHEYLTRQLTNALSTLHYNWAHLNGNPLLWSLKSHLGISTNLSNAYLTFHFWLLLLQKLFNCE